MRNVTRNRLTLDRTTAPVLIAAGLLLLGAALHGQPPAAWRAFPTPMPPKSAPCTVNVNTARPDQIAYLARTGRTLAARIVAARQAAPSHKLTPETLDAVKGVGPSWLAANGPHIRFGNEPTTCTAKVQGSAKAAKGKKAE